MTNTIPSTRHNITGYKTAFTGSLYRANDMTKIPTLLSMVMISRSPGLDCVKKGSLSNSFAEGRVGAFPISFVMNFLASSSFTSSRHSGKIPYFLYLF